jgi:hypothetical protein
MDRPDLRALLLRLRAGESGGDVRDRAREALVAAWGPEADALALDPDEIDGILAVLDEAEAAWTPALRDALGDELPEADVVAAVMATLAGPEGRAAVGGAGVAAAVEHEAGRPPELAGRLDPDALPVAEAVAAEAGAAPDVGLRFAEHVWPLPAALAHEAGHLPDLARSFDAGALPIAEAVADEAGPVALADVILRQLVDPDGLPEAWLSALLDRALPTAQHVRAAERAAASPGARATLAAWADVGRQVREGVVAEGGAAPAVWRAVAAEIGLSDPERVEGWDEALLGEAVSAQAGPIDVVDAVMARVQRDALAPAPEIPEPANGGSWVGVGVFVAMAAIVLLALGLRFAVPGAVEAPAFRELGPVTFASAEELQVDKVHYGENQSVFVETPPSGDEPVVIWVDDGGNL